MKNSLFIHNSLAYYDDATPVTNTVSYQANRHAEHSSLFGAVAVTNTQAYEVVKMSVEISRFLYDRITLTNTVAYGSIISVLL